MRNIRDHDTVGSIVSIYGVLLFVYEAVVGHQNKLGYPARGPMGVACIVRPSAILLLPTVLRVCLTPVCLGKSGCSTPYPAGIYDCSCWGWGLSGRLDSPIALACFRLTNNEFDDLQCSS
jgi:hypothetical protein